MLRRKKKPASARSPGWRIASLGDHYLAGRNFPAAIGAYQEALWVGVRTRDLQLVVESYRGLAEAHLYLNQLSEAIAYMERGLDIARETEDEARQVLLYHLLIGAYYWQGSCEEDKRKAIPYFERGVALAREFEEAGIHGAGLKDEELEVLAGCLSGLGEAHLDLGDFQQAASYYWQAAGIARRLGVRGDEARCLGSAGSCLLMLKDYKQATVCFRSALAGAEEIGDEEAQGNLLLGLGSACLGLGNFQQAIAYFRQGLEFVPNKRMRTRYLGGLGEAYRFLGDVNQAIAHLEQALALVREKGDTEMEIRFLTGDTEMEISFLTLEGDIYSELGDLRRGIENYRKALEIAGKAGDRRRQARLLSTLGTTYSWLSLRTLGSDPLGALASLKEAERFCRQALTLAEETDYKEIKVRCLVDLGAIYTLLPHTWLQGENYLRRALAMARDYGYRLLEGNALAILASRYQVRRELTKALACYQEALAIAQTHAMPHLCWKCKRGIGLCYRTQGKPESAMACLLSAMDDVERIGSSIPIERLEAAYFETVRDVYHDALSLALEQDQVEVAIEIAERSKARSLIQLLTNRGIKPRPRTTDVPGMQELVAEERRLWESITVLRRRLLGEGSRGEPRAAAEEEELLSQLEVLERQYGEVFDKMRLTNPSYASLVKPSKFSLAQFRQALKAKLTPHFKGTWHCVEYYLLDERLLGFYMNDNEARVIVDKHLDERKRRRLDIALDHSSCRTFYHRQDTEDLAELYNLLVPETLTTKLGEDDLLIISPHGELHFLPFHALYDTSRQRYLVQQVSVSYTPNLYTLQLLLKGADFAPPQRPLLLGNPTFPHPKLNLPFAEQEALKLHKKVYRGCGRLLLREKASAEAISAMQRSGELLNYDVLHFASHALYDGQNPLMSGVLLYDERRKSFAILDVAQIFDLCLKAKIVSLSACQSGLAEVLGGDQIVGLSTAFLYAGAETIVASLWQVGDEATFELMTDFHRRLRAGVGRSRALREAQVAMINEGKTPFQWACFEVIGVP